MGASEGQKSDPRSPKDIPAAAEVIKLSSRSTSQPPDAASQTAESDVVSESRSADGRFQETESKRPSRPALPATSSSAFSHRPPTSVLSENEFHEIEVGVVRKLDWIIMPVTMLLYLFTFLDSVSTQNLNQVQTTTGNNTLGLSETEYYVVQALYYLGLCIFAVPLTLIGKLFDPTIWLGLLTIVKGASSILKAISSSFAATSVAQFFSGSSQGTFSSTVPLYYTYWYTRDEIGLRVSLYYGIAAGLGIPTVILGKLVFFILPNRPEKSHYLTKRQRIVALARAKEGLHPEPPDTIDKKAINPAFHDLRIYFYAMLYTCALFPSIALLYFIPGILTEIGFVEMPGVALMLVPPLASSFVVMIVMARTSDRMRDRGRFIGGLCVLGAVGFVLLLTVRLAGLRYFAVFLVSWGTFPTIPLTLSWIAGNCATETKRSLGLSIAVSAGNSLPIAIPWTFPASHAPDYFLGFALCTGFLVFGALLAIALHVYCRWENARSDHEYGDASMEERVLSDDDVRFRYFY